MLLYLIFIEEIKISEMLLQQETPLSNDKFLNIRKGVLRNVLFVIVWMTLTYNYIIVHKKGRIPLADKKKVNKT